MLYSDGPFSMELWTTPRFIAVIVFFVILMILVV